MEGRIVVTKDSDFVDSFLLTRKPPRLLLVSTGNISNRELERLFLDNIEQLRVGFTVYDYYMIALNSADSVCSFTCKPAHCKKSGVYRFSSNSRSS